MFPSSIPLVNTINPIQLYSTNPCSPLHHHKTTARGAAHPQLQFSASNAMQLLPSHRRWPINETQIESDTRLHSCSDWDWAGFCNNHHSRRKLATQSAENKTAARRFRSPLVVRPSDLSGDATIAVAVLGRLLLLHPAASGGGAVECNNNCRKDNRTKKFQHLLRPIVVGWAKTLYLFVARR